MLQKKHKYFEIWEGCSLKTKNACVEYCAGVKIFFVRLVEQLGGYEDVVETSRSVGTAFTVRSTAVTLIAHQD